MLIWKGEQQAGTGTYWDISTGERIEIKDQDVLPGGSSQKYIKASGAMMLLLGPALGLMYAVFLPFIGIAMAISFTGTKIVNAARRVFRGKAREAGKVLTFGWKPLEGYLASKRRAEKRHGESN